MRYRKLDDRGDYILGRRDHFLTGREAVGQAIKTRLLHLLGEWWEYINEGTPLFEEVLATFHDMDSLASVDLIFSDRILGTEGVTEIDSYDSDLNVSTRAYTASCVVNTQYGKLGITVDTTQKASELLAVNVRL